MIALSREQFGDLAERNRHTLWLVAVGMTGDRHLAEDVVQDALAIAWKKIAQFDPATNFPAWTAAIVRHVALNQRRKSARRNSLSSGQLEDTPTKAEGHVGSPIDAQGQVLPDQHQFDDRVMEALSQLSESARSCLLLRTVKGLSYEAIAQLLDLPPGTAMSHVYRARRAMRQSLDSDSSHPTEEVA